jgi:prepilin signal peptidase PulO-like enzyme (type II secretory pathway)
MGFDINFFTIGFPIFVIGMIIGSFLNCVIWRSYCNESAAKGRSYCPKCRHQLAWFDLIPVLSFIFLKGRCRYCNDKISWQYPIVEITMGVFFVVAAEIFSPGIFWGIFSFYNLVRLAAYWIVLSSLMVIFVTDIRWYFIPDGAIVTGILAVLVLRVLDFGQIYYLLHRFDWEMIAGPLSAGFFVFLFFLSIFLVSRGAWMGFGDVKYSFLMGFLLGPADSLVGLFLSFFLGAILGLTLVLNKKKKISSEIPFGPFLVTGTLMAMFFSTPIITWYLSIGAY